MTKPALHVLLDDLGFSQAQLAKAIGYPRAALRAFRSGTLPGADPITAEDIRLKLLDIAIMVAGLGHHAGARSGGVEQSALFEIPVVEGYSATGWDLYQYLDGARCARARRAQGSTHWRSGEKIEPRHNGLCLLAQQIPGEEVLDRFIPDWRTRHWMSSRIVVAADGNLSIIPKDQP